MYRNDGLQFVYSPLPVRGHEWCGEHSRPCSIWQHWSNNHFVCWPQVEELTEALFGENVVKQCVANYVHLIIVKIYNHIEDNVLRICLLDLAYTVLQDINSVQKKKCVFTWLHVVN